MSLQVVERLKKARTFAQAVAMGKKVDEQVFVDRLSICQACEYKRKDRFKHEYCGICGCSVSSDKNRILVLPSYIENLPLWGCKHPQRKQGKGWKR